MVVAKAARAEGEAATKIVDDIWRTSHPLNGFDAAKYLLSAACAWTLGPSCCASILACGMSTKTSL